MKTFMDTAVDKRIIADIQEALGPVAAKHGISIKTGRWSYSESNITLKVEMAIIGEGGEVQSREVENFKQFATTYGVKEDDLGREITLGMVKYKLVGLNTRKWKKPFVLERADGKQFVSGVAQIQRALGYKVTEV